MIDNISIKFAYTDYTEVSVKYQNRLHSVILNVGSEIELNLISLISVSMIKYSVARRCVHRRHTAADDFKRRFKYTASYNTGVFAGWFKLISPARFPLVRAALRVEVRKQKRVIVVILGF